MTKHPKPTVHGRDHASDGPDPVPGIFRVADETTLLPFEPILNFTGDGVTATDNPGAARTDVTISSGGGGGGSLPTFASGFCHHLDVTPGFSGYLFFSNTHYSGITISGTTITISTSGVYEVHAAGFGYMTGPASNPYIEMLLEVNGTGGDSGGYAYTNAEHPAALGSGAIWQVPMVFLDQLALSSSDVLKFQGVNNESVQGASFDRWRVVVTRLA